MGSGEDTHYASVLPGPYWKPNGEPSMGYRTAVLLGYDLYGFMLEVQGEEIRTFPYEDWCYQHECWGLMGRTPGAT